MSVDNFKRILEKASPADIEIGLASFHKYRALTSQIAALYHYSPLIGAAVFSALSPNNDYHGNLRDAHRLLRAAYLGQSLADFKVCTYGNNKIKAWRIVQGENPLTLITAKKTRNFFLNINNPFDPLPVTIDGHMYNIWRGKRESLVGLRQQDKLYDRIADDVRQIAQEWRIIPCQAQGILWNTWRRMHQIKTSNQLTFWDEDYQAAQLGLRPYLPLVLPCPPEHASNQSNSEALPPLQINGKSKSVVPVSTADAAMLLGSAVSPADTTIRTESKARA